ncbi:MAG: DMT family transporter [Proteobacteria bacterium]|nr:DMT family transporter [Pseudomonadota bacterium]
MWVCVAGYGGSPISDTLCTTPSRKQNSILSLPIDVSRRPLDLRATLIMLALSVLWALQQVVMKAIQQDIPPTTQLAIRFIPAAVFFGIWTWMREGAGMFRDGTLPSGLLMAVMFSLEFILVGEALRHTTAAHSIVFLYTSPIFTALGVQFLPEERLSMAQWVGIGIAVGGISVAFLGHSGKPASNLLLGDTLAVCAAVLWGLTNVILRRGRIGNAATTKTVFYQVAVASIIIGLFARFSGQWQVHWSTGAILSMTFQVIFIAITSYLVWFWLLRHYLTSRLMLMTLLTPLIGVCLGALFLGDPIDTRFALGTVLVLGGVLFVNRRSSG